MSETELAEQLYSIALNNDKLHNYSEAMTYYKSSVVEYMKIIQKLEKTDPQCHALKKIVSKILDRAELLKKTMESNQSISSTHITKSKYQKVHTDNKVNKVSNTVNQPKINPQDKHDNKDLSSLDSYEKQIYSEIIDTSPNIHWNDVSGLVYAKQVLMETVILPSKRPDIFTGLLAPPRGILLFGPPGTGKTMIAKAVASESEATFFSISASSLTSKYVGESEKTVRAMFSLATKLAPAVIFIDEIDSLLCKRSDNENEASRRIKTEFLIQMDGVKSDGSSRILVIGATNRPYELDDAVLRRLAKKIYIPLPDEETRESLIKHCLKNEKVKLSDTDMKRIIHLSNGYSGSDLTQLCKEALMNTIRDVKSIDTIRVKDIRAANVYDFMKAFQIIKPSVSADSLEEFEKWNKEFGVQMNNEITSSNESISEVHK